MVGGGGLVVGGLLLWPPPGRAAAKVEALKARMKAEERWTCILRVWFGVKVRFIWIWFEGLNVLVLCGS